ncbi:hypothetical protein FDI40_gp369 [Agrobacterium phage Atu_ph07]|uniref:Uncharacterized protein n=1 Tax=Agrobacterium phage Atu_ph07 TaxID=2024264 RepID=A0A2L0V013_9CAUD|nr:hypothetical protein FDI40_gp369 [Agrobacterium phage Atu_ph07]AUZ95128.1 hypothetical protein [Agrobacterium phage Atu_ph07]
MEWIYLLYVVAAILIAISFAIYSTTGDEKEYSGAVQLYAFGIVLGWAVYERYIPFWGDFPDVSYLLWIGPLYLTGMVVVFVIATSVIVYGALDLYKKNRDGFIKNFLAHHNASSFDADLLVRYNRDVRSKFFQFNRDYLTASVIMWPSFLLVQVGWFTMNLVKSMRFIGNIPERIVMKVISKKFNEIQ